MNTTIYNVELLGEDKIKIDFIKENNKFSETFDKVLLAVGRSPNTNLIDIDKTEVITEKNFIVVDKQMRTNVLNIFAIGDVVGQPMLAHKASHEGKIAAEVICGKKVYFDAISIPSVAYTEPEVAWCGYSEKQLIEKNYKL